MADGPVESSSIDTHSLNASSYDAIAEQYLSWSVSHQSELPSHNNPRLRYLEKLLSLLQSPTTATVLDLGCGAGVPCTQILARRCYHGKVVGVDSSNAQIELARKYVLGQQQIGSGEKAGDGENNSVKGEEGEDAGKMAEVELKVAEMTALTFPPGSFDAVVAFYSVVHLPRDELKGLLAQIAEWLVSENKVSGQRGYLLLNLGTTDNPGAYNRQWLGSSDGHMFWSSFDSATNLDIIENAGLEVVESAIVEDKEDGTPVPFLWVLAKKG